MAPLGLLHVLQKLSLQLSLSLEAFCRGERNVVETMLIGIRNVQHERRSELTNGEILYVLRSGERVKI